MQLSIIMKGKNKMINYQYNTSLLDNFPELKKSFKKLFDFGDGNEMETGPHITTGGVFTPFLIQAVKEKNSQLIIRCSQFIDYLLINEDDQSINVVMVSIIEYLEDEGIDIFSLPISEKSKDIIRG